LGHASSSGELALAIAFRLPGDYNNDGVVDARDYAVYRKYVGQTGGALPADGSGRAGVPDGVVDQWDYNLWVANFGSTAPPTGNAVPAPQSLLLILIGVGCLLPNLRRLERRGIAEAI
jgi:hypothetical protein